MAKQQLFAFRDIMKYENVRAHAAKYPEIDPASSASCMLLLRVASDILSSIDDYLAGHGMSHGRWTVLLLLYRTPDLPQHPCELAWKAGVTRATMTGLLDGLERDDLLSREKTQEDGRMFKVALRPKGRKFLEQVMPGYFRIIREMMSVLPLPEREALIELLTKLGAGLQVETRRVE